MEMFNQRNNLGDIKFSKKTLPEPVPSGAQPEQSALPFVALAAAH